MKLDFWHLVVAGILIIVGAWIVIKVVGALVGFVLWLLSILAIFALVGGLLYFGYLLLKPRGSRI